MVKSHAFYGVLGCLTLAHEVLAVNAGAAGVLPGQVLVQPAVAANTGGRVSWRAQALRELALFD